MLELQPIIALFSVPLPVIREPTDYIPNSADTSNQVSREVTEMQEDTDRYTFNTVFLLRRRKNVLCFH